MEMVMSSSSDASAQRRRRRVGRRRGVLRGLAGAALRRALSAGGKLRGRGGSIAAKICGVVGGPPADD